MDWANIINQVSGLVVGLMIFALFIGAFLFFNIRKYKKLVEGRILCNFFGPAGWYFVLCKHEGNKVEPPEGHHIQGSYLITSDCIYQGQYPPGWPKIFQVGVAATAYIENEDVPIVAKSPKLWQTNPDRNIVTASMRRTVLNESAMKTAMVMQTNVWKDIASMAQFIKHVPTMFYINLGVLGGLLIIGYLVYMTYAAVLTRG
jgi:hypothetical protein